MYSLCLSNRAVHPASHNWPMDSNEPDANLENMCARRASGGNCRMSSRAVCVDFIVAWFGSMTSIGCAARCTLMSFIVVCMRLVLLIIRFLSSSMKVPVAPVSATTGCFVVVVT